MLPTDGTLHTTWVGLDGAVGTGSSGLRWEGRLAWPAPVCLTRQDPWALMGRASHDLTGIANREWHHDCQPRLALPIIDWYWQP